VVDLAVLGLWLDSMNFGFFSNLNDAMIILLIPLFYSVLINFFQCQILVSFVLLNQTIQLFKLLTQVAAYSAFPIKS